MVRFSFYKQADAMDCGPTCLKMISAYYGNKIPLNYLREKANINKEGVSLLGIGEAAEAIGFRTQAIKLSFESLAEGGILPCILHWQQNHFVVLYKISKKGLYVADPARGLIIYNTKEFKQHWISDRTDDLPEGIAIFLEPSPLFYEAKYEGAEETAKARFKSILYYLLPYKKLISQLFIGLGIGTLLQLILPFLTQSIVDVGVNTSNLHFVYIVLLAQLALLAGKMVLELLRSRILLHMSTRINVAILTDFLMKLMKLPVAFFDSKKTGDILQRMNDHQRIESFLTNSSLSILFSLISLATLSVILAVYNIYIFLIFATGSFLYALWIFLFLNRRKILDYKEFNISSKEQGAIIQLIHGMQDIKLLGVEKNMRWGWEKLRAKHFTLRTNSLSLSQAQQSGAFFINEGKNIFITFLAAKAVIDEQMTLGAMLSVQYIIGQLNSPIEQIIGFVQSWQNARISLDRLNEIHHLEDEEPDNKSFVQEISHAITEGSSISLQNISFTYPGAGNEPVLKNINLDIPFGKTTAIVGVSGSGKTTLLKLLLKFYEVQSGEIRSGAIPLNSISHRSWRSHCGVVMQESFIFSDTIARNIAVGEEKIDLKRLQHAVSIANAGDFINALPLGFNTQIGAEGTGISMGQKQRILIARSVYRNPDFIFFDEATNSLDANNESVILHNLNSFFKGRTVLVVAHRLSTVKNADQIVVLNKGIISERGTHSELINRKGEYYMLVKNQLELGE